MKSKKIGVVLLVVALIGVCIFFFLNYKSSIFSMLHIEKIREYIDSYGKLSVLIFIFAFSIRTVFVIFPYSVMVLIGGSLFGVQNGFIYSMLSVYISSSIAFFIARFASGGFLEKLLGDKIKKIDLNLEKHGFNIILTMRASYVFPYDLLSYASGLTKIRYRDFVLGTTIGMMPETFSLTLLGYNMDDPFSYKFLLSIGLIILTVGIPYVVKKIRNSKAKKISEGNLDLDVEDPGGVEKDSATK